MPLASLQAGGIFHRYWLSNGRFVKLKYDKMKNSIKCILFGQTTQITKTENWAFMEFKYIPQPNYI